ncbi:MDR family MFS transporter [Salinibius halmophilus]|uniref:MDR family MFS transporter n=1 Tax=Salinibius halmophilus TaxID=1853216 RepID=UPI000E661469|nr:MDR family MFS transporter [Salinibius halmophilus]
MSQAVSRVAILVGILTALFLAALDQTIIATALPSIASDLSFPASLISWLATSYLVASTVSLPIWGKLSDIYGRKATLLTGVALFVLASVLCGFANSPLELVLLRALQGLGSAGIFANVFAIVGEVFTPRERPKFQGLLGAMFGLASLIGPWIGGLVTDAFGWQWVFWLNLPLGLIAMAVIAYKLPPLKNDRGGRIQWLSVLLLVLGVVPIMLVMAELGETRALLPSMAIALAFGVLMTAAFIYHEWVSKEPVLNVHLFRNPVYGRAGLATFVLGMSFLGTIIYVPLFAVNAIGVSATIAGAALTPLTFGFVLGNVLSGQLVSRIGFYKPVLVPTTFVQAVLFMLYAFWVSPELSFLGFALSLFVLGLSIGPTLPLYTQIMISSVSRDQMGVASSNATFIRQVGATLGLAMIGLLFTFVLSDSNAALLSQFAAQLPTQALAELQQLQVQGLTPEMIDQVVNNPTTQAAMQPLVAKSWSDSLAAVFFTSSIIAFIGFLFTAWMPDVNLHATDPVAKS